MRFLLPLIVLALFLTGCAPIPIFDESGQLIGHGPSPAQIVTGTVVEAAPDAATRALSGDWVGALYILGAALAGGGGVAGRSYMKAKAAAKKREETA